jgi:hypothetical protein
MLVVWGLVMFLFALFLVLGFVGAFIVVATIALKAGSIADVARGISVLTSFKISSYETLGKEASMTAGATILLVVGLALAIITGLIMRSIERSRSRRLHVTPLLPTKKKRFIACEEGVCTFQIGNRYTRSRLYRLRPWTSLELDQLDPAQNRVALRDGKTFMYLRARPASGQTPAGYEDLARVVTEHLPPDKQTPQHKPLKFGWRALAVSIVIIVASANMGLASMNARNLGKPGDGKCDICGNKLGYFYVQLQEPGGKTSNEYCQLHGHIYAILQPAIAWNSALSRLQKSVQSKGLVEAMLEGELAFTALFAWVMTGLTVVIVTVPRPLKLDQ